MRCPSYRTVYWAAFALGALGLALRGATDGRSMGALTAIGALAMWAGICSIRGDDVFVDDEDLKPGSKEVLDAPFWRGVNGVGSFVAGMAFVAIGLLATTGAIAV